MDWNEDGKKDLILGEGNGYIRIYLNTNTDADPVFSEYQFVQVGGSDFKVPEDSCPFIIDWNNDGKKDLLVGENYGYIHLLLNEGTNGAPIFTIAVRIKDGEKDLSTTARNLPVATDWNGDKAKDLLIGDIYGQIFYFENKGSDSDPVFSGSKLLTAEYCLDVGLYARHDVVDWNNDGIKDIISGESGGKVIYFQGENGYYPDLEVYSFSVPSQASPGEKIGDRIELTITNLGNCPTGVFFIGLYISTDPVITTDDELLVTGLFKTSEHLDINEEFSVPIIKDTAIPTSTQSAFHYVGVLLDVHEELWELDEGNNCASQPILIDDLTLGADTETVPLGGGSADFLLHAGATNAGRNYLLVGGVTGTSPGMPLPGSMATLPINWDVFSDLVMTLVNSPVFSNFMGQLDGEGTALAQLNVPPLPSSASGLVMYFAFCCNNPFNFVSNAVEIEVVP